MTSKGRGGLLTQQVLVRMSEEEYAEWTKNAADCGMPMNVFVRRIMGQALGIREVVEDVDRRVAEGKSNRAAHMRTFRARPGSDVDPSAGVAARRAS